MNESPDLGFNSDLGFLEEADPEYNLTRSICPDAANMRDVRYFQDEALPRSTNGNLRKDLANLMIPTTLRNSGLTPRQKS